MRTGLAIQIIQSIHYRLQVQYEMGQENGPQPRPIHCATLGASGLCRVVYNLLPGSLAQALVSAYPWTMLGAGGIRKLGTDGQFATPEGPVGKGHNRLSLK
jgi:hypothetical protein